MPPTRNRQRLAGTEGCCAGGASELRAARAEAGRSARLSRQEAFGNGATGFGTRALVIFLLALGVRLGFALAPLSQIDAAFVPDDTYYVLAIARSLAAGDGPSTGHGVLTNGFQPLFAWLLVPLFQLGVGAEGGLRGAVILGALFDALCAAGLFSLARRSVIPCQTSRVVRGPELVGVGWALSPVALGQALNGLETSLALATVLAACLALDRIDQISETDRRPILAGFLLGLALLARIDAALLCVLVAVWLGSLRRWRALARIGVASAAVVTPWWVYEWVQFGTLVPSSGPAVRAAAISLEPVPGMTWTWAALTAVNPWLDLPSLRGFIIGRTSLYAVVLALAGGLLIAGLTLAWRRFSPGGRLFLAFGGTLVFFYLSWVPAVWFFQRYLLTTTAGTLLVALSHWDCWHSCGPRRARIARVVAGILVALQVGQLTLWAARGKPADRDHNGIKGYAAPARAILGELGGAGGEVVLGAFQSGALGYFAAAPERGGIRVLNLDGVVDARALAALESGTLLAHLEEQRATHLADWEYLVRRIWARQRRAAIAAGGPVPALRPVPVFTAPAQADLRFVLFALERPALAAGDPEGEPAGQTP